MNETEAALDFRRAVKGFYRSKRRNLARSLRRQLAPLLEAIGADKVDSIGPFGLCGRWSVYFHREGQRIAWMPLEPESDGKLFYRDFSKTNEEYGSQTIGAINGLNHPTQEITQINLCELRKLVIWCEADE